MSSSPPQVDWIAVAIPLNNLNRQELIAFFGCRLGTGVIDLIMMFVLVEIMKFPGMFIKFLANIFVIVLNYVASKVVIFKK